MQIVLELIAGALLLTAFGFFVVRFPTKQAEIDTRNFPLIATEKGMYVVDDKREQKDFNTCKGYFESCYLKEQLEICYTYLMLYESKFGKSERYHKLFAIYIDRMDKLTEKVSDL